MQSVRASHHCCRCSRGATDSTALATAVTTAVEPIPKHWDPPGRQKSTRHNKAKAKHRHQHTLSLLDVMKEQDRLRAIIREVVDTCNSRAKGDGHDDEAQLIRESPLALLSAGCLC